MMTVEAPISSSSNDFFTFLMYETMYANTSTNHALKSNNSAATFALTEPQFNLDDHYHHQDVNFLSNSQQQPPLLLPSVYSHQLETNNGWHGNAGVVTLPGMTKKKRKRRRVDTCKNREEVETQRLTHIVMERNRRKQMNEHLAALRCLMPDSYAQRGDQASIVGGAIEYVKELEHLLQSLEAQKLLSQKHHTAGSGTETATECERDTTIPNLDPTDPSTSNTVERISLATQPPPFSEFFFHPQYTWSQSPKRHINSKTTTTTTTQQASTADIEVTLIETHANLRILSRKTPRQLSRLISGFQLLNLTILHLIVTSVHPLVLYSISAKVEEGCQLTSVDEIADATHQMLQMIEDEAAAADLPHICY